MLKYDKYPMNAWVYGLSFLIIFLFPLLYFMGCLIVYPDDEWYVPALEFFDHYFAVTLFPKKPSLMMLFMPFLGIILLIVWYFIHVHVYCVIIERISVAFRKNN